MDVSDLLKRPEGKTLEFKRDVSNPARALETITAFANTAGGTLVIGVEDRTRRVRGVREPLDLEERLANLISDRISPSLVPEVRVLAWRKTYVVAVRVHASPTRPHFLASEGPELGVRVRVGSTNRRADHELVGELRRFARGETFDELAVPEARTEDLDFDEAAQFFAPVRRLRRSDLESLRLVTLHQGRRVPTVGGLILFGRDRERFFPDAWMQVARFGGTNKATILDRIETHAHPGTAIEETIAFVRRHTTRGAGIGSVRRRDLWSLPPVTVREAVINAVVHADYSQKGAPIRVSIFEDRIEIENPGLLPFGLTVEDLHRGVSRLRNRVIGRAFHAVGLIEQWGSGIQRMTRACREAGLLAPEFEEIATRFRTTIWSKRGGREDIDTTGSSILELLAGGKGLRTNEIARAIGLSTRSTRKRLTRLVALGLVLEISSSPNDPQRRYYASE